MKLLFLLIGSVIGSLATIFLRGRRGDEPMGVLKVAKDDEGDYLFLDLDENINKIRSKKTVTFYVQKVNSQR